MRRLFNLFRFRRNARRMTFEEIQAMIEEAANRPQKFGPMQHLEFDDSGMPLPPWQAHPEIERYSIGWRMGGGEDYIIAWHEWYGSLSDDANQSYKAEYPEEGEWDGFYRMIEERNSAGNSNG